jgi:hypothetical protein
MVSLFAVEIEEILRKITAKRKGKDRRRSGRYQSTNHERN